MILRPVRPVSPCGPPMTKRPVGLMWYLVFAVDHVARHHGVDDVLADLGAKLLGGDVFAVLGRDDDGVDANGLAVDVFDRNLTLAVGAQIVSSPDSADFGEPLGEAVRQLNGQGHQFFGLVAGVAEHQALIAGAAGVDAHGDIGRLALNGIQHAAGLAVEADRRRRCSRYR